MGRRFAIVAAGTASAAAIFVVTAALAAYGSPRLEVIQTGNRVTLDIAQSTGDDPTAITRIISPIGTAIAQARPVGTTIGTASAVLVATQAGGAPVAAQGALRVVGGTPAAATTGCTVGERVVAVWGMTLTGDGLTLEFPVYVLVGGDLLLCLPHPSTQDRGTRLVSLQLTLDGPLDIPRAGTWISIWVPYGSGDVADLSRVVASPATVGPGAVTFTARARGAGAVLVGFVRHGGSIRTDARIRITGGPRASTQRLLGTASTNRQGQFTFRAKKGTVFRATATVPRASPPGLCFVLESFLRPIPCINPTLNGFTVQSTLVRRR
jgi:hypothetical protein